MSFLYLQMIHIVSMNEYEPLQNNLSLLADDKQKRVGNEGFQWLPQSIEI